MKNKSLWLRIGFSALLLGYLAYTADMQELRASAQLERPIFLLWALLVAFGDRIVMAYKWNLLLRAKQIWVGLVSLTGTYWVSSFLGLFLPATVGADALRAYAVSKNGHNSSDVISSIVVERILGFVALFIMVLFSIILSVFVLGESFFGGIWNLFWVFALLLFMLVAVVWVSLRTTWVSSCLAWFQRRFEGSFLGRLANKLEDIYRSYQSYQNNLLVVLQFLGWSLIENLFPLTWTYFLSLAFGIDVPVMYFFILIPIVSFLVRLPISLDGIGIQEGAYVYFLGLIGVARADALFLGIASHVLAVVSILPGAVMYGLGGLSGQRKLFSRSIAGEAPQIRPEQEVKL